LKAPFPRLHKSKSNISILTFEDYVRIRQNVQDSKKDDIHSQKLIESQKKTSTLSRARAHLKRMKDFDLRRPSLPWCSTTREQENKNKKIILYAQQCKENDMDLSKKMNQMLNYAKVVSIRDEQKLENKKLKSEIKKKDLKLDLMMELERLRGIKKEEEDKLSRKIKKIEEAEIIRQQMKDKIIRKKKERNDIIKEGEEIKKHFAELELEDKILEQQKINEKITLAKEIVENNKILALNKYNKIKEEKENDLKILQYNMEKLKKEEKEAAQKKYLQIQKEIETQKLREKQEKISDNQALIDELRAKRYTEEIDKKEREKEKIEAMKLLKQKKELIEGNEEQKIKKKNRLMEEALKEQKEYENIIKHQIKEKEEEKLMENLRRKTLEENGKDVLKQIREKKEKKNLERRIKLEDRKIWKQNDDKYIETLERIKMRKLNEMDRLGIKDKYKVELKRFKIV